MLINPEALDHKLVALLCRLTAPSPPGPGHSGSGAYSPSPELVLNCVRATAKLSLLEPFRAQLNQKQANLRHVSALVAAEDDRAHSYERGGGDGPWPQWHTWPLLSRVCFTLANLTSFLPTSSLPNSSSAKDDHQPAAARDGGPGGLGRCRCGWAL